MTTAVHLDTRAALWRAANRARWAPSIHNTQPWRLRLHRDALDLHLDPERILPTVDPDGRQALISCGCALFNARVSLACEEGAEVTVARFPEGTDSTLLARLHLATRSAEDAFTRATRLALADLDFAVAVRRTNRNAFEQTSIPARFLDRLTAAAAAEGTVLFAVRLSHHRAALARLTQVAADALVDNPAYRAEVESVDGKAPVAVSAGHAQTLLLLGTDTDHRRDWLRAGEAVERVLLTAALSGYEYSPVMPALEVPDVREMLRFELGVTVYPQFLLRLGRGAPVASTSRRPLTEILTES
ncbi:hypothetical protein [Sporichthya polymorpha]|uniref:hypothetical protein n=1 Tax=Sporichthya polymorpha TaxID=35751 RepID=UPI000379226D|nr:hypothetical protein [Sporichthya polymorpha]